MSERGFYMAGDLVSVLTAEPLDRRLDYKAPEGGVFAGAFVMVPLGPRRVLGVVWGMVRGIMMPRKYGLSGRLLMCRRCAVKWSSFCVRRRNIR